MDQISTAGRTTYVNKGPSAVDRARALNAAQEIPHLKRVLRLLPRNSWAHSMLSDRVRTCRGIIRNVLYRRYPTRIAYGTQWREIFVDYMQPVHIACSGIWQTLRNAERTEVRNRRARAKRMNFDNYYTGPNLPGGYTTYRLNVDYTGFTPSYATRTDRMLCGVHTTAGSVLNAHNKRLLQRMFSGKLPTDDQRWASVEIECIAGVPDREIAARLVKVAKYVCIKGDSSVHSDYSQGIGDREGYPMEIVVTAPAEVLPETVAEVCKVLKDSGGYVNQTCGLHLHLDMRAHNRQQAYTNLVAGQALLRLLVPEHRIKNRYCAPVTRRAWPKRMNQSARYKAINAQAWQRHQTIEVRLFAGTLDADKIAQYLKVCSAIAYSDTIVVRTPRSVKAWGRTIPALGEHVEWLENEAKVTRGEVVTPTTTTTQHEIAF